MSKSVFVKMSNLAGIAANQLYDLVDNNNYFVFQQISGTTLLTGLTVSVDNSTSNYVLYASVSTPASATWSSLNPKTPGVNSPAAPKTYATFDTTLKSANITRNSGTSVTNNGGGNGTILATINGSSTGVSTGKWYWEYTYTTKTAQAEFGVYSGTSGNLDGALGSNAYGYGYYSLFGGWWIPTNSLTFNVFTSDGGSTYPNINQGDIVGVALDAGANTVKFYLNGTLMAPTQTISGGNYFPAIGIQTNGGTITANFGASAFTYTVPSGYNSGYYS